MNLVGNRRNGGNVRGKLLRLVDCRERNFRLTQRSKRFLRESGALLTNIVVHEEPSHLAGSMKYKSTVSSVLISLVWGMIVDSSGAVPDT